MHITIHSFLHILGRRLESEHMSSSDSHLEVVGFVPPTFCAVTQSL